jgi:hypothetical protein
LALIAVGLTCAAVPAVAQFPIFRDEPPRPPADVPDQSGGFPPPEPRGEFPPPTFPQQPSRPLPPLAAPINAPPAGGPRSSIQSQPLPPPPGGTAAPRDAALPSAPGSIIQPEPGAPPGAPPAADGGVQPTEVVVAPPPHRIANPTAVFAGLDKITGRIIKFDVAINETVQFGALQVTPRVCYSRPPTEAPRTDAFLAVDEVTLQGEVRRIFSGWMFASSPGLHAVEHPIYDVWLTECKGGVQEIAEAKEEEAREPPPPPRRATRRR